MDIVISLPIGDRATSHAFYAALGLEAVGELASDGLPEPLQFTLSPGANLMLVPRGGFGWVIGDNAVAEPGTSECVLSLTGDVDALVAAARAAGRDGRRRAGPTALGLHRHVRRPRRPPVDGERVRGAVSRTTGGRCP